MSIPAGRNPAEGSRSSLAGCSTSLSFVLVLAGLAYANGLTGDFLYDDFHYIVDNPQVQSGSWREAWTEPLQRRPELGLYRPLAVLTYQGQARGRGAAAPTWPFHAVNVGLHVAVTGLVWLLARRLGMSLSSTTVGAALFAVHPMHAEAVSWIVGRAELLAALFGMAFLCCMLGRNRPRTVLAGTALWMLACLGKEGAFALPGVLIVLDRVRPATATLSGRALRYGPLVAALLILTLVRFRVLGGFGPDESLASFRETSPGDRPWITLRLLADYLRLSAVPYPSRIFYHYSESLRLDRTAVLVLVLACAGFWLLRRRPLRALLLAGVVALLPFLNLRPIQESFAERFLYLPSAFFCLWLGSLLVKPMEWESRRRKELGFTLAIPASVLLTFLVLTSAANRPFDNALALWSNTARHAPGFPFPHYQLGYFCDLEGIYTATASYPGARREYEEALRLDQELRERGLRGMPEDQRARAHLQLGILLADRLPARMRDYVAAEGHLRQAEKLGRDFDGLDWEYATATLWLAGLRAVPQAGVSAEEALSKLRSAEQHVSGELKERIRAEREKVERELADR